MTESMQGNSEGKKGGKLTTSMLKFYNFKWKLLKCSSDSENYVKILLNSSNVCVLERAPRVWLQTRLSQALLFVCSTDSGKLLNSQLLHPYRDDNTSQILLSPIPSPLSPLITSQPILWNPEKAIKKKLIM